MMATARTWRSLLLGSVFLSTTLEAGALMAASKETPGTGTKKLLEKPAGDPRSYQQYVLPANGLTVVNVQDDSAVDSAFSVAVEAGSYDDPKHLPGLAHFCEHMLFLGTKKYPDPTSYDSFVNANGGYMNAYTASEVTVYYTQLAASAMEQGLDRFADFFRAPLFDTRFVEKEVHAIDSEHAKNVQNPSRRVMEVMYKQGNPRSPVSAFHTGDINTLYLEPRSKGVDPVQELKRWYQEHYCPSKMKLVTYGKMPLAKQQQLATRLFGDIGKGSQSCQSLRRSYTDPPAWPSSSVGKWLRIKGTQPQASLHLTWPLPDTAKEFLAQPVEYMNYVMTYGGVNSLSYVLQDTLGLVSGTGFMMDRSSAGSIVWFQCDLTQKGQSHPEQVIDVLYQYLGTLKRTGVNEQLYKTLANITLLQWNWKEKADAANTVSDLAERLTRLPPEHLLSGDELIVRPNSTLVASLLERMVPETMNAGFVDPSPPDAFYKAKVQNLSHYAVLYSVEDMSPGLKSRWSSMMSASSANRSAQELEASLKRVMLTFDSTVEAVPPSAVKNVPSSLNLANMQAKPAFQEGIIGNLYGLPPAGVASKDVATGLASSLVNSNAKDSAKVWYRSGWVTRSPEVMMQVEFRPYKTLDQLEINPIDPIRLSMFSSLINEELGPKLADQTVAGASYSMGVSSSGIFFTFSGYQPLLPRLVDRVVDEFKKGVDIKDKSRFLRQYEELERNLRTYSDMPISYAVSDRNLLLTTGMHSREETRMALQQMSASKAAAAAQELMLSQPLHFDALVMGNMPEAGARELVARVRNGVHSPQGQGRGEVHHIQPIVEPSSPLEVRKLNPRKGDPNDAVVVTVLNGVATIESRVILGMLGQILFNVAYTELRTKRQLGYVVNAGSTQLSNVDGISCIVQGNTANADKMEAAVEYVYSTSMPQMLSNMTTEQFTTYKDSFKQSLLSPPNGKSDEFSHFWGPISQGGTCFELQNEMLKFVETVASKQQLIDRWSSLLLPSKGQRKKVVVKYFANKVPAKPEASQAEAIWKEQGVNKDMISRMLRERSNTQILNKVDSTVRANLLKTGGKYYPQDIICKNENTARIPQQATVEMADVKKANATKVEGSNDSLREVLVQLGGKQPLGYVRRHEAHHFLAPM